MMCGVLANMSEQYKDAQTFLERATGIDSHSVVAWTLLGESLPSCSQYHYSIVLCTKMLSYVFKKKPLEPLFSVQVEHLNLIFKLQQKNPK